MAGPLNDLMCKTIHWQCGNQQVVAFKTLQNALSSAPVLRFPDLNKGYTLFTDARNYGLGVVFGGRG